MAKIKIKRATLKGLGLDKMNRVVEIEDTAEVRGMIRTVRHMVQIQD
jgi:large subunit ribosomal protein L30